MSMFINVPFVTLLQVQYDFRLKFEAELLIRFSDK